jgi:hypothetical protein
MPIETAHSAPSELATSPILQLCRHWRTTKDFEIFRSAIRLCIDEELVAFAEFRDRLALMPAVIVDWAEGSERAPIQMQEEVIEFLERNAVNDHPRRDSARTKTAVANYRQKLLSRLSK